MLAIKSPFAVAEIAHDHIRQLVTARFAMLLSHYPEPYDPATHGWFLIIADGDQPDATVQYGCPNLLLDEDDVPFGDPTYFSPYEFCIDHGDCFELVRVISDYGEAVAIFIPNTSNISAVLRQLCLSIS